MAAPRLSPSRVAVVGASSLLGKELSQVLEERSFPAADIRLLDEDVAVGRLTQLGDEPAVIGAVDEQSFADVRFAFFTGAASNTTQHWKQAKQAGAKVIDLSDAPGAVPGAVAWVPALDSVLARPQLPSDDLFRSPSSAAIIAATLAAALSTVGVARLALLLYPPVSERGQQGIEELEAQTVRLLSFQPIAQEVYDAQVAFNLLGGYGAACKPSLTATRAGIARDLIDILDGRVVIPAFQLVQAPVFYGYTFSAFAEIGAGREPAELEAALAKAGMKVQALDEPMPSSVSVAGEFQPVVARIERDPGLTAPFWIWGAADNLRLAAGNAVSIAERLLAC